MLSDDQLEAWDIVLGELKQQFEQPTHRNEIGILFRLLHRAIGIPVDLFGRKVDLGWLVDQQKARNRAVVLRREQMQGKQCRQMVGQMVFATARPTHRHRTLGPIEDDRQLRQVEPCRVRSKFGIELLDVSRHLCGDVVEDRGQALVAIVGADLFLKLLDFIVEITTTPKIGLLSFGFILAGYFSSNGMLAMMRSFDKSYRVTFKKRSGWKKRVIALALTGLLGGLVIASVVLVILGNVIVEWLSEYITLAGFSTAGFAMLRWISIIFLFYFGISVIYRYGAATYKRFSFFSPGATLATILSLLSSMAFSLYIDEFERYETYNKFYGSIAAIIIVMLWIQLNSLILLIGFELNASIAVNRDLIKAREEEE